MRDKDDVTNSALNSNVPHKSWVMLQATYTSHTNNTHSHTGDCEWVYLCFHPSLGFAGCYFAYIYVPWQLQSILLEFLCMLQHVQETCLWTVWTFFFFFVWNRKHLPRTHCCKCKMCKFCQNIKVITFHWGCNCSSTPNLTRVCAWLNISIKNIMVYSTHDRVFLDTWWSCCVTILPNSETHSHFKCCYSRKMLLECLPHS